MADKKKRLFEGATATGSKTANKQIGKVASIVNKVQPLQASTKNKKVNATVSNVKSGKKKASSTNGMLSNVSSAIQGINNRASASATPTSTTIAPVSAFKRKKFGGEFTEGDKFFTPEYVNNSKEVQTYYEEAAKVDNDFSQFTPQMLIEGLKWTERNRTSIAVYGNTGEYNVDYTDENGKGGTYGPTVASSGSWLSTGEMQKFNEETDIVSSTMIAALERQAAEAGPDGGTIIADAIDSLYTELEDENGYGGYYQERILRSIDALYDIADRNNYTEVKRRFIDRNRGAFDNGEREYYSSKRDEAISNYNNPEPEEEISEEEYQSVYEAMSGHSGVYDQNVLDMFRSLPKSAQARMMNQLGAINGSVDLSDRPSIDPSLLEAVGWTDVGDGKATIYSSNYGIESNGRQYEIEITPITRDGGDPLSPQELDDYVNQLIVLPDGTVDENSDPYGLVISAIDTTDMSDEEIQGIRESKPENDHLLQEIYYNEDITDWGAEADQWQGKLDEYDEYVNGIKGRYEHYSNDVSAADAVAAYDYEYSDADMEEYWNNQDENDKDNVLYGKEIVVEGLRFDNIHPDREEYAESIVNTVAYMTDAEKGRYKYIYDNLGKEEAAEYFDALKTHRLNRENLKGFEEQNYRLTHDITGAKGRQQEAVAAEYESIIKEIERIGSDPNATQEDYDAVNARITALQNGEFAKDMEPGILDHLAQAVFNAGYLGVTEFAKLGENAETVTNLYNKLTGKAYDPYDAEAHPISTYSTITKSQIGDWLGNDLFDGKWNVQLPQWLGGGKLIDTVYGVGTSILENVTQMALAHGLGSTLGISGDALKSFTKWTTLSLMGGVVFNDALYSNSLNMDLTENQAFISALWSTAVELGTETVISMDDVLDARYGAEGGFMNGAARWKAIKKAVIGEGYEELVAEVLDFIPIAGMESELEEYYNQAMLDIANGGDEGLTEDQLKWTAWGRTMSYAIGRALMAGVGGSLSGGIMGAGGSNNAWVELGRKILSSNAVQSVEQLQALVGELNVEGTYAEDINRIMDENVYGKATNTTGAQQETTQQEEVEEEAEPGENEVKPVETVEESETNSEETETEAEEAETETEAEEKIDTEAEEEQTQEEEQPEQEEQPQQEMTPEEKEKRRSDLIEEMNTLMGRTVDLSTARGVEIKPLSYEQLSPEKRARVDQIKSELEQLSGNTANPKNNPVIMRLDTGETVFGDAESISRLRENLNEMQVEAERRARQVNEMEAAIGEGDSDGRNDSRRQRQLTHARAMLKGLQEQISQTVDTLLAAEENGAETVEVPSVEETQEAPKPQEAQQEETAQAEPEEEQKAEADVAAAAESKDYEQLNKLMDAFLNSKGAKAFYGMIGDMYSKTLNALGTAINTMTHEDAAADIRDKINMLSETEADMDGISDVVIDALAAVVTNNATNKDLHTLEAYTRRNNNNVLNQIRNGIAMTGYKLSDKTQQYLQLYNDLYSKQFNEVNRTASRNVPKDIERITRAPAGKLNPIRVSTTGERMIFNTDGNSTAVESFGDFVQTDDGLKIKANTKNGAVEVDPMGIGTIDDHEADVIRYAMSYGDAGIANALSSELYAAAPANVASIAEQYSKAYMMAMSGANTQNVMDYMSKYGKGIKLNESIVDQIVNKAKSEQSSRNKGNYGRSWKRSEAVSYDGITVNEDGSMTANGKTLTAEQAAKMKAIEKIAEIVGFNVRFTGGGTLENGNFVLGNGNFAAGTNTISIDVFAGLDNINDNADNNTMLSTLSHELAHYIQAWSADRYMELCESIMDLLTQNGEDIDTLINSKYSGLAKSTKGWNDFTDAQRYAYAYDEVVAEGLSRMLLEEDVMQQFAQEHKGIFDKIVEFFKNLLDDLKEMINKERTSEYTEEAKTLKALEGYRDLIQQTYNALEAASQAAHEAMVQNAEAGPGMTEVGPAVVSEEIAQEMESDGYVDPNKRDQIRTTAEWRRQHMQNYPQDMSFAMVSALVDNFNQKVLMSDVARYAVPHGIVSDAAVDRDATTIKGAKRKGGENAGFGKANIGPLRSNEEYGFTFDLDTKCERTYNYLYLRNAIQNNLGRQLTSFEARQLIELMRADGRYMIPCTYCYVEGKRMMLSDGYAKTISKESKRSVGYKATPSDVFKAVEACRTIVNGYMDSVYNVADNYVTDSSTQVVDENGNVVFEGYRDFWMPKDAKLDDIVRDICERYNIPYEEKLPKEVTEKFSKEEKARYKFKFGAQKVIASQVSEWIYNHKLDVPVNLSDTETDWKTGTIDYQLLNMHDRAVIAAQGGVKANVVKDYVPYTDEVSRITPEEKAHMNAMGGARIHSSNDFQVGNLQDYLLFFSDLAADKRGVNGEEGWFVHTYSKNLTFANIFSRFGARINCSVAFYTDRNGNVVANEHEGCNQEQLKELRKTNPNVGAMAMVTDNAQLAYALNSDWVDMIIPFHASGMPAEMFYDVMGWQNYTSIQGETEYSVLDMKRMIKAIDPNAKTGSSKADVTRSFWEHYEKISVENAPKTAAEVDALIAEGGKIVRITKTNSKGKAVEYCPHFFPYDSTDKFGNFIPGHHNSAERYKQLCDLYGGKPRFAGLQIYDAAQGKTVDITDHSGYVKLIKETARTDSEQQYISMDNIQEKGADGKSAWDLINEAIEMFEGYEGFNTDPGDLQHRFIKDYVGENGEPIIGTAADVLKAAKKGQKMYTVGEFNEFDQELSDRNTLIADKYYEDRAARQDGLVETIAEAETYDDKKDRKKVMDTHYVAANPIKSQQGEVRNQDRNSSAENDRESKLKETHELYKGVDLSADGHVYDYDFLTSLPPMEVTILPNEEDIKVNGRIDRSHITKIALEEAEEQGVVRDGKVYVENDFTGRELRVDVKSARHSLNGDLNRLAVNSRFSSVIGSILKRAVPINGLKNTANDVVGTYAMASYAESEDGHKYIGIATIEMRTGEVDNIEVYEVAHSVSARHEKSSPVDHKSQGVYPSTAATISIQQLLEHVNSTYRSILSKDVLNHLGEERPVNGYYSDRVKFQDRNRSVTDQELIMAASNAITRTNAEREYMQTYKKSVEKMVDLRSQYDAMQQELNAAREAGNTAEMMHVRDRMKLMRDRIEMAMEKTIKMERETPLRSVLKRIRTETEKAVVAAMDEARGGGNVDQAITTLTARYDKRIAALEEKLRQERSKPKQGEDNVLTRSAVRDEAKIKALQKQVSELRMQMEALRINKNTRIQEEIQKRVEAVQSIRDQRERSEYSQRVRMIIDDLNRRLAHPTEGHFMPAGMAREVVDVLEAFDLSYKKNGEELVPKRIAEMREVYERYKDDAAYVGIYNPQLDAYMKTLTDTLEGVKFRDLTKEQMVGVYNAMKGLQTVIADANNLKSGVLGGMKVGATVGQMITDIENAQTKLPKALENMVTMQLTPDNAFARAGGFAKDNVMSKIQKMFVQGEERMLEIQRLFANTFKGYTSEKEFMELGSINEKKLVDVGLKNMNDGSAIKLTRSMMLALYMHLSSTDNYMAIARGGLNVPNLQKYYKGDIAGSYGSREASIRTIGAQQRYSAYLEGIENSEASADGQIKEFDEFLDESMSTLDEIKANIESQLTEYERSLIESAHMWNDQISREMLNEVSMDMLGFKKANVENYFPIRRDKNFVKKQFDSIAFDGSLAGAGFMKERVKASQPVLLADFIYEMMSSGDQVARYVGFVQAERDFNILYNGMRPGFTTSVKEALANKFGTSKSYFGTNMTDYIEHYVADITGTRERLDQNILDLIRGNMARYTLTANVRVAFSQLASIPTGAGVLGWKAIAKGLSTGMTAAFSEKQKEEIAQKNAWYWNRYRGEGSTREMSEAKADRNALDRIYNKVARTAVGKRVLNWCQDFDCAATAILYKAAEAWATDNTEHAKGSAEWQNAVDEIYTETLRKTQPMYSVTERSDLMRTNDKMLKFLTMFKTQASQNFNMLYGAIAEHDKMLSDLKNGVDGVTAEDVRSSTKRMAHSISAALVGAVTFAMLRMMVNMLTGKVKRYRDKDDNIALDKTLKAVGLEALSSLASMVAFGSEIYTIVESGLTHSKYYGIEETAFAQISEAATDLQALIDGGKLKTRDDYLNAIGDLFVDISALSGIPVENFIGLFDTMTSAFDDAMNGTLFAWNKGISRQEDNQYNIVINKMLQTGKAPTEKELAKLMKDLKKDKADDIANGIAGRITDRYESGSLTREQAQQLMKLIGKNESAYYWDFDAIDYAKAHKGSSEGYRRTMRLEEAFKSKDDNRISEALSELTTYSNSSQNDVVKEAVYHLYKDGMPWPQAEELLRNYSAYSKSSRMYLEQAVYKIKDQVDFEKNHPDEDWRMFGSLFEAMEGANGTHDAIAARITELMNHKFSFSDIASAITKEYSGTYKRFLESDPAKAELLLSSVIIPAFELLGVSEAEEREYIRTKW